VNILHKIVTIWP